MDDSIHSSSKKPRDGMLKDLVEIIMGKIRAIDAQEEETIIHFSLFDPSYSRDNSPTRGVKELKLQGKVTTLKPGDEIRAYILAGDPLSIHNTDIPYFRKRPVRESEPAVYIERGQKGRKVYGNPPKNTPIKIVE
ncbi:hypothetical protein KW805_01825 [Candidatus Pacearchaeota archaeon]|nr:hypothetical protein [Candidatus Pacearchaeota archaeon]